MSRLNSTAALRLLLLSAVLFGAGSLSAVPLTMTYRVTDLGGGSYQYDFRVVCDNNDNTYASGQGWGWLIFGDSSTSPAPLTNWQISSGQLPVGPWTGMSSSSGGHNGPTFSYVLDAWIPTGIGDSIQWTGTSTANLAQGQLLWSTIAGNVGSPSTANFTVATRLDPDINIKNSSSNTVPNGGTQSVGTVATTATTNASYTIENNGNMDLSVTSVTFSNHNNVIPSNTSLASTPSGTVTAGNTTAFSVDFNPTAGGTFSFDVTVASNDPDTPSYTFTIDGVGQSTGPSITIPATGSNWQANGNNFELTVDPGASVNDALTATDPNSDPMTVTVTPPGTAPTTLSTTPVNVSTPTGGPLSLDWVGTIDATNAPTSYVWQISVSDGTTPTNFTATIFINDLAPVHAAGVDSTGGNGQGTATPYTGTALVGSTAALTLADMTNPNTGQAMTLGTVTPDSGNPAGGSGFGISLVADSIVVTPTTALVLADVGTHIFAVDIDDAGNTTTVFVSVEVQTPEIDVERNSNAIADPGTDTVTGALAGQPTVLTYIVTNNGTTDLTITTVVISNLINCSANVTSNPANTVTPTNSTSFQITVTPGVAAFSFDFDINNDDVDENPYDIAVSGNATAAPEIDVSKGAVPVADGASDTIANPRTGIPNTVTYTISNNGTSDLSVSGVSIGGLSNCTANVTSTPAGTVTPGNSTSFMVEFTPTADGPFSFTIAIANDDANENPYDINVNGTAATTGTVLSGGGGGGGGGCASGSTSSTGVLALLVALMLGAAVYRRRRA